MHTLLNLLFLIGIVILVVFLIALCFARSKQEADKETDEVSKRSEAIASGSSENNDESN